jgi:hypothetical protein
VYDLGNSQPDPIEGYLLSAFWIVELRNLDDRGLIGELWRRVIPYGFGVVGVLHGKAEDDGIVRMLSLGIADESFGDVGREGCCVRERLDEDVADEQVDDPEEKADRNDERDEDLLRAREKTEEVYDAREKIESVGDGNVAESGVIPVDGTCTSFRITMKEK